MNLFNNTNNDACTGDDCNEDGIKLLTTLYEGSSAVGGTGLQGYIDLKRIREEYIWTNNNSKTDGGGGGGGLQSNSFRQQLYPKLLGVHELLILQSSRDSQDESNNINDNLLYHPTKQDIDYIKNLVKDLTSVLKEEYQKKKRLQKKNTAEDDDEEEGASPSPLSPGTSSPTAGGSGKSVTFSNQVDDNHNNQYPLLSSPTTQGDDTVNAVIVPLLQSKEERQILRKILIQIIRCHYPNSLGKDWKHNQDFVTAVAILWNCLDAPSMTSLVLNRIIPYHWKHLNNQFDKSKDVLHAVFQHWDNELYQKLDSLKVSVELEENSGNIFTALFSPTPKPESSSNKEKQVSLLDEVVLQKWIPYWFVNEILDLQEVEDEEKDGINNTLLALLSSPSSATNRNNKNSNLLRLWDVFVSSSWYCPIYFSIALLIEYRHGILGNCLDWKALPRRVLLDACSNNHPTAVTSATPKIKGKARTDTMYQLERVIQRCQEGLDKYPFSSCVVVDDGEEGKNFLQQEEPSWLSANLAPTDQTLVKLLRETRMEQESRNFKTPVSEDPEVERRSEPAKGDNFHTPMKARRLKFDLEAQEQPDDEPAQKEKSPTRNAFAQSIKSSIQKQNRPQSEGSNVVDIKSRSLSSDLMRNGHDTITETPATSESNSTTEEISSTSTRRSSILFWMLILVLIYSPLVIMPLVLNSSSSTDTSKRNSIPILMRKMFHLNDDDDTRNKDQQPSHSSLPSLPPSMIFLKYSFCSIYSSIVEAAANTFPARATKSSPSSIAALLDGICNDAFPTKSQRPSSRKFHKDSSHVNDDGTKTPSEKVPRRSRQNHLKSEDEEAWNRRGGLDKLKDISRRNRRHNHQEQDSEETEEDQKKKEISESIESGINDDTGTIDSGDISVEDTEEDKAALDSQLVEKEDEDISSVDDMNSGSPIKETSSEGEDVGEEGSSQEDRQPRYFSSEFEEEDDNEGTDALQDDAIIGEDEATSEPVADEQQTNGEHLEDADFQKHDSARFASVSTFAQENQAIDAEDEKTRFGAAAPEEDDIMSGDDSESEADITGNGVEGKHSVYAADREADASNNESLELAEEGNRTSEEQLESSIESSADEIVRTSLDSQAADASKKDTDETDDGVNKGEGPKSVTTNAAQLAQETSRQKEQASAEARRLVSGYLQPDDSETTFEQATDDESESSDDSAISDESITSIEDDHDSDEVLGSSAAVNSPTAEDPHISPKFQNEEDSSDSEINEPRSELEEEETHPSPEGSDTSDESDESAHLENQPAESISDSSASAKLDERTIEPSNEELETEAILQQTEKGVGEDKEDVESADASDNAGVVVDEGARDDDSEPESGVSSEESVVGGAVAGVDAESIQTILQAHKDTMVVLNDKWKRLLDELDEPNPASSRTTPQSKKSKASGLIGRLGNRVGRFLKSRKRTK